MKKIIIGALLPTLFYSLVLFGLSFSPDQSLLDLRIMVIISIILAIAISALFNVGASHQSATGLNLAWLAIIIHTLGFRPEIWQDNILLGSVFLFLIYSLALIIYYFVKDFVRTERTKSLLISFSSLRDHGSLLVDRSVSASLA